MVAAPATAVNIEIDSGASNYGVVVGVNTGTINNITQLVQAVTSLHQLRAPLADFIGRTGERAQLAQALSGPQPIAAICGMDGLGKTELAITVAHQLVSCYPDAQLVISLRSPAPQQPRTTAAALRDAIRAFDPAGQLPDDPAALAALYRGHLGGRRALILLDDAPDDAAVQAFLPPPGCALLITSRTRLTLGGQGLMLDLPPLARAEARTLLCDDAPRLRGDPAVDGLLAQCDDLPLAVRAIGAALAANPALSAARYLARLADESRRRKALHGTGSDIYAALGLGDELLAAEQPALAARWRMLAICPAPFEPAVAAAIWDEDDPDLLDDNLALLLRRSLLRYDTATGRYRIHTLLRDIAHERRAPDDDATARLRHARHFLAVAEAAAQRFQAGHADMAEGLTLFDQARPHLESARLWTTAQSGPEADELCSAFPLAIYPLLPLRLQPREQIEWIEPALAAALRLGVSSSQSAGGSQQSASRHLPPADCRLPANPQLRLRIALGHARRDNGEPALAAPHYQAALERARTIGDRPAEALAGAGLAGVAHDQGRHAEALAVYQQVHALAAEAGNREGEARALINIGTLHTELGEPRPALKSFAQSLSILRALGNQQLAGVVLNNLGDLYRALGELPRAIESYHQSLAAARALGNRYVEGVVLGNLSLAHTAAGDRLRAADSCMAGLTCARAAGDHAAETEAGWQLGQALVQAGEHTAGQALLRTIVEYERYAGRPSAEARAAELGSVVRSA